HLPQWHERNPGRPAPALGCIGPLQVRHARIFPQIRQLAADQQRKNSEARTGRVGSAGPGEAETHSLDGQGLTRMRAAIVKAYGPIESLSIEDVPAPVPGPNEALIDIHAAPVNFVDLLVIAGKYQFLPKPPFTPGKGPAGIVRAIGSAVTALK